jgi:transposase
MTLTSIADISAGVTVGVDTHKHTHFAIAKDGLGRDLGHMEIDTNPRGYAALLKWSVALADQVIFGVEGTSSYGAGLARHLRSNGQLVIEVLRPTRQDRRLRGKSDSIDAGAAAAAVQAGKARAVPKVGDDGVEMIRALKVAKSTAIKARTQCMNALKALIMTGPDELREQLRDLTTKPLISTAGAFRVLDVVDPMSATKWSIRSMARRYAALDEEVKELEDRLDHLTQKLVPELRQCVGVGQDVAALMAIAEIPQGRSSKFPR